MSSIQEKMATALASKDQGNEAFKNGDIKKGNCILGSRQQQHPVSTLCHLPVPQLTRCRINHILTHLYSSLRFIFTIHSFDKLPLGKFSQDTNKPPLWLFCLRQ
jgi:hypothetical protein